MKKKIRGIVICGGKSSRMMTDKGLLLSEGKTWVDHARQKFIALGIPYSVSIRAEQWRDYASIIPEELLIEDRMAIEGPLVAILSAHQQFPSNDLLFIPCDLKDLSIARLEALLEKNIKHATADAFVYEVNGRLEPLCCLISSKGLSKVMSLVYEEKLPTKSVYQLFELLSSEVISLPLEAFPEFKNYNTPEDLV